jgi:hypothetical protein
MGLSLYSVDGGISQANNMAQGIQNANLQLQAQNDLAAQNYNEQKEVDKTQATNDLIRGGIDSAKMVSGVKSALNPAVRKTVAGGKAVGGGFEGVQSSADVKGLRGFIGGAGDVLEKGTKIAGTIGSAVSAGQDIYDDIKSGHVAGDNWEEQTANIGNIVGGVLDVAGLVPGLQILGAVGGIVSAGSAALQGVGDSIDAAKDAANKPAQAVQEAIAPSQQVAVARTE